MAATGMLSSRPDLHTVSSSVPINYSSSSFACHKDHSCAIFDQSATSNTLLGNSCYEVPSLHDSYAFINGGYCSPDCERTSHTLSDKVDQQNSDEDDVKNKNSKMNESTESSSEIVVSPCNVSKDVKFVEIKRKTSIPALLHPQTIIKLMRAKSESASLTLTQDNKSDVEQSTNPHPADNIDIKLLSASSQDVSQKQGSYLHKVTALFKRRKSKSLNKLASQSYEELTRHVAYRIDNTRLNVSGSQESITEINTTSTFNKAKKTSIKGRFERMKDIAKEAKVKDGKMFKRHGEVEDTSNNVGALEECMMKTDLNEDIIYTSSNSNANKKELTCSLIRHEIGQKDTSHGTVMRMSSIRKRKIHIRLFHHFITTRSPMEGNGDIRIIKEATHVHSLDRGETVVTDILSNSLVLFDPDGHPKVTFSLEPGSEPWAVCSTPEGCLAVTLKRQGCVSLWTHAGEPVSEFGHNVLLGPTGIQCDHKGRFIVADEQANSVCVFNNRGEFIRKLKPSKDVDEAEVDGAEVDEASGGEADEAEVTTLHEAEVTTLHEAGVTIHHPKNPRSSSPCPPHPFFNQPRYVCITNSGNYVITDSANHSVKIFDKDFIFRSQFGGYGRQDGYFKFPYGVACDAENNLYIADHFNNRVSLFSPEGEFIEHLLTLQDGISRPKSLAVDHSLLYVTHGNMRSNKVSVFKLNKQP